MGCSEGPRRGEGASHHSFGKMRAHFSACVPSTRRTCKREEFCSHTSDCSGPPTRLKWLHHGLGIESDPPVERGMEATDGGSGMLARNGVGQQ